MFCGMRSWRPDRRRVSYFFGAGFGASFEQTPHVPPPFAQCLHDEHVLHALQFFAPVHVAANVPALKSSAPTRTSVFMVYRGVVVPCSSNFYISNNQECFL